MPYPKGVNIERSEDARKRRKAENHHNMDVRDQWKISSAGRETGLLRFRITQLVVAT